MQCIMARMPERWLDGSTRPPDEEVEGLRALVARLAGPGFEVERAPGGMSTPVYRLRRADETRYLRASEDPGGSMRAEAAVHEHLRAAGVSVPEVVAVDDAPEIGRGVMLIREIEGEPFAGGGVTDPAPILRAAGRDLARINAVAVRGFGWIRRDEPVWPLRGEDETYAAFVDGGSTSLVERPPSRLAHGDFDATHIYQRDGVYTGVIDLGEMRGAEPHYDLAYFLVQDPGRQMLDDLLAGYADIGDAPGDLRGSATVIVATQLCRWIDRDGVESLDRPSGRWWLARLAALLQDAT
jgi:aminoglycoside phosphotransferase (APT) family kinase protein